MKPLLRSSRVFLAAILLGSLSWVGPVAASETDDKDKVFVGYLFRQPRKINYGLYTHLCHAFLTADAEGNVDTKRGTPSRAVTDEAHKAGVKVILSLGGWGWDRQFASIVSKPVAEDRYANAVMGIIDTFEYDGIDFDWEYPDTKEEVVGFERLARRFRKQLDELSRKKHRPMVLTMAASSNAETLRWLSKEILVDTLDWVKVMTYDFAGAWTSYAGHNSPLFASSKQPGGKPRSTEQSMMYLVKERGIPANKLAVGIPLYGRGFSVAEPYASTKNAPPARSRAGGGNYSNIEKLLKEGWTRRWDDETKTPWLIAPDKKMVIGYDDAESVALKSEWAMKQGFRGVFFWQIGGDLLADGTNPLQEAAHRKWAESARKRP